MAMKIGLTSVWSSGLGEVLQEGYAAAAAQDAHALEDILAARERARAAARENPVRRLLKRSVTRLIRR